eukprot:6174331-Pleurochrysis_carterae.AAC.1
MDMAFRSYDTWLMSAASKLHWRRQIGFHAGAPPLVAVKLSVCVTEIANMDISFNATREAHYNIAALRWIERATLRRCNSGHATLKLSAGTLE